jgi:5'-3' exonuclease
MDSSIDKKKLFSIFNSITPEERERVTTPKNINSDVLIVDLFNLFIRCYSVFPNMNDNGDLSGGLVGSLKSLAWAIREIKPTRCIIVADGAGGSKRRKSIYPEYKSGRKNRIRVNRMYADISTPDLEERSMREQFQKFVKYLGYLPVTLISVDNIEADDTIAYLCTTAFQDPLSRMTIMSADKDFLQLVNERVSVWSPTKKRLYGQAEILNEYGIHPKNFVLYRILEGDISDNINGITGAGLKTVKKLFPEMSEDVQLDLEYLRKKSEENHKRYKLYQNILSDWSIVERNYSLMQLKEPDFASVYQTGIRERIDMKVSNTNLIEILKQFTLDGIHDQIGNVHVWIRESFSYLDGFVQIR